MADLLQQLPNGGAVVAVIVITLVFLKKQERYEDKISSVSKSFVDEIAAARRDYLERLDKIMREHNKSR
jgi:hypothetical protein